MKYKGRKIPAPKPIVIVIPRDEEDIVFQAKAVVDYKEFEKLCPEPEPVRVLKPGGIEYLDYEAPEYEQRVKKHGDLRVAWLIITSLNATPELQWEVVKINEPDTWEKYEEELKDSGLIQAEVNYIVSEVMRANIVDEKRIKEAHDRFFSKKVDQEGK